MTFTPDGQHLLSGDEEGVLIAWDLKQAKRVHSSRAHSGPVWSLATSHGSGAILASGDPHDVTLAQHEFMWTWHAPRFCDQQLGPEGSYDSIDHA